MLKIPSWRTWPDLRVTAYQDDTMFWKYYLIPDYLTVRRDPVTNKPIFLLVAYAFGDQDRAENPDLPRGGGFLVMDVELAVTRGLETIKADLQKDTNELWQQLKDMADAGGASVSGYRIRSNHKLNGKTFKTSLGVKDVLLGLGPDAPEAPPGDKAPSIIIADPTWVEGAWEISAPAMPGLVTGGRKSGQLSLLGGNVAAANLELTSAGADFMVQALVDKDAGAADITPVQVFYQMKFLARVPPVSVNATADSRSVYMSIKSVYHDYEGHGCSDDEINHSEQLMEMAVSSRLIEIKTDVGDPDTPPEIVNQIRADATKAIQQMLTDKFFDKKPAPTTPEGDPVKDWIDKGVEDVYYLKSEAQVDFSHFEYREELSSVRKWPVNPQGTMQAFLAGIPPQQLSQFVRRLDLDDPFFQTLQLKAEVFGVDWDKDPIDFVEVEFDYQGTDENGRHIVKPANAVFKKGETVFEWDPSLIGSKREYRYRSRIGYRGHPVGEWSAWESSMRNRLPVPVAPTGRVALEIYAGNIDFGTTTKAVQVNVSYADPANGVPAGGTTFQLKAESAAAQSFERWIYVPKKADVSYSSTFFLKNDQQVDVPATTVSADRVFINEPHPATRLDVRLMPVGDWSEVVQSLVSLRYADAVRDINAEGLYLLKTADEYKNWSVYTAPGGPRDFEYQVVTSFKDGSTETKDWSKLTGDQVVPVAVKAPPVLEVTVIPTLVDFAVTPVVEVTLKCADPAPGASGVKTFALTASERVTWKVPLRDAANRAFTTKVTYNTSDGRVVELPEEQAPDDMVTLSPLRIPTVGCTILPKLVDFDATPVVTVTLTYSDPAHGVSDSQAFVFTDQTEEAWKIPIADGGPKDFTVQVSYSLADGTTVTREPVTTSVNKLVIPKYLASA
ncbi:MAG TPA: hypothetical protein PKE40_03995 [Arachnia sp.]|nr:hypothetical protein [Arachnia sp.]HMT85493.1 hypothetical protein [Arachnia sp.]